uniref:Uncharacterized protein n=1 Tax=Romanomermis culicivorax TaxID=13658 RepID=A0A915KLY5_ROMCU
MNPMNNVEHSIEENGANSLNFVQISNDLSRNRLYSIGAFEEPDENFPIQIDYNHQINWKEIQFMLHCAQISGLYFRTQTHTYRT